MSRKIEKDFELTPAVSFPAYCRLRLIPVPFRWTGDDLKGLPFLINRFPKQ